MIKIGILGDIGSGKSHVAQNFGYPVFNADSEVAKLYKEDKKTFHLTQARPHSGGVDFLYEQSSIFEDKFILLIFMLQEYLTKKGLNFLFFNAFDRFDNFETNTYKHLIDTTKWVNNDVRPGHFKEFILAQNNLKDWHDSEYFITSHPRDIAHIQWGNYLTTYIKENESKTYNI